MLYNSKQKLLGLIEKFELVIFELSGKYISQILYLNAGVEKFLWVIENLTYKRLTYRSSTVNVHICYKY